MPYKNLVIINNEKIFKENNSFYCDNIDLKTIPENLNKNFNVTLIARSSKIKRARCINLEKVEVSSNIYLTCQRCLEELPFSLDLSFSMAFVKNENQAEELSKHLEIYLFEEEELSIIDLISDEILLSIPMVPKHNLDCLSSLKENNNYEQGKENPFAILKNINKPMEARSKNGSSKK